MPPVTWNRGPWATRRPYQDLNSQRPRFPYQSLSDPNLEGPGSSIGTGVTGPDTAGPMTSDERSTYGAVSDPVGYGIGLAMDTTGLRGAARDALGTTIGGIVSSVPAAAARRSISSAVPGYGVATSIAKTPGILESLMQYFGLQPTHRSIMEALPVEMQGLSDRYGYGMPAPELGWGQTTPGPGVGGVDMGNTVSGGLAGVGQAPGDTRDQTGESGSPSAGNSNTSGTADSTGGSRGTDGPDLRRGGVKKTKPGQSMTRTFGERGPEQAIFIPQRGSQFDMTKPGIQGNERQVRSGVKSAYKSLMPRGGR